MSAEKRFHGLDGESSHHVTEPSAPVPYPDSSVQYQTGEEAVSYPGQVPDYPGDVTTESFIPPPAAPNAGQDLPPPPAYESLFGKKIVRLKSMKEDSKESAWYPLIIFFLLVILVVIIAAPVGMIYMGVTYLDLCSTEPMLPIYWIVAGITMSLTLLLIFLRTCCSAISSKNGDEEEDNNKAECLIWFDGLLILFGIGWFFYGNYCTYWVWTHKVCKPRGGPGKCLFDYTCDETLRQFSFWMITGVYMLIGMVILCGCCCVCYFCIKGDDEAGPSTAEEGQTISGTTE